MAGKVTTPRKSRIILLLRVQPETCGSDNFCAVIEGGSHLSTWALTSGQLWLIQRYDERHRAT